MPYDVILESVTPGFRLPVIAAVVTLTKTVEHEGMILFVSATGLGLGESAPLVDSSPVVILRSVSLDEAEQAKRHLEAGYFPAAKDWPRPAPGRACCVVTVMEST